MASNMDSRGVSRGACTKCACPEYNGGDTGMRCAQCGHAPAQHQRLTSSRVPLTSGGSLPQSSELVTGLPSILPSDSQSSNMGAQGGNIATGPSHGHPAGAIYVNQLESGSSANDAFEVFMHPPPHDYYQYQYHDMPMWPPPPPDDLPTCKGCSKQVHYDYTLPYDMRAFEYCSPECRDKVILVTHQYQLDADLEDLRMHLRAAAQEDKSKLAKRSPGSHHNCKQYRQGSDGYQQGSSSVDQSSPRSRSSNTGSQKTTVLDLKKEIGKEFGLILHAEVFQKTGFLITGVKLDSSAHKQMQGDKPRFLEIIETVNQKPYTDLSGSNTQQAFDEATMHHAIIRIQVNRCIALPPHSRLLSKVKDVGATHIIVLRHIPNQKQCGLQLNQTSNGMVHITDGTIEVKSSGIKSGDKICTCILVDQSHTTSVDGEYLTPESYGSSGSFFRAVVNALERADKQKKTVVLAIQRL